MHEHELDHVFVGYSDAVPVPDPDEVSEWRRVSPNVLLAEMTADPSAFTVWFHILMQQSRPRFSLDRAIGTV
jgi:isopentenyl-diphosphate delta-isomerase